MSKLKGFPYAISHQSNSIVEQSFSFEKLKSVELYFTGKKYEFYLTDLDTNLRERNQLSLSVLDYKIPEKDWIKANQSIVIINDNNNSQDKIIIQSPIDSNESKNKIVFFQTEFDQWGDTTKLIQNSDAKSLSQSIMRHLLLALTINFPKTDHTS